MDERSQYNGPAEMMAFDHDFWVEVMLKAQSLDAPTAHELQQYPFLEAIGFQFEVENERTSEGIILLPERCECCGAIKR